MKYKDLIVTKNKKDDSISKYDYRSMSAETDRLYNTLLYRDVYVLDNREEVYKDLLSHIDFFHRLPNARKIPRLQLLEKLHHLYLGNLALCEGDIYEALKHYFKALSVKDLTKKVKDIKTKKCSRVELVDLMPIVYNIAQMYKLVGLDDKANQYLSTCHEATHMWTEIMKEEPIEAFTLHPLRDSMGLAIPGYDFCCEEYFDSNIGRANYRFNTGLDDYEQYVPQIKEVDGKEYVKIGLCSQLLDREKLQTVQAAKILADIKEF